MNGRLREARAAGRLTNGSAWGLGLLLLLTAGCWQGTDDLLVGHWIGRPRVTVEADSSGSSNSDPPAVAERSLDELVFELDLLPDGSFRMALRRGPDRDDERNGRYRITRVYGPRRDLILTADDPPYEVVVEVVLEGSDRMLLREMDSDSRLDEFVFERRKGDRTPNSSASALTETGD